MADYYPVLKKTVAALPENTGAARREIYQRARKAIVAQLKGYDPPLSPSEITAEQLRLEESIRRVEAEAARDSLGLSSRPAQAPAAPTPKAPPPAPAEPEVDQQPEEAPAPRAAEPAAPAPRAPEPRTTEPRPAEPRATEPRAPAPRPAASTEAPAPEIKAPAAPVDDTVSARKRQDGPADAGGNGQRREPSLGTGGSETPAAKSPRAEPSLTASTDAAPGGSSRRDRNRKRSDARAERAMAGLDGSMRTSRLPSILGGVAVLLLLVGVAAIGYSQRNTIMDLFAGDDTPAANEPTRTAEQPADQPAEEDSGPRKNSARLLENGETAVAPDARSVSTTRITPSTPGGQSSAAESTAPAQQPRRDVTSQATETPAEQTAQAPETPAASDEQPETPAASEEAPAETPQATPATPQAPAATADNGSGIVAQRAILYEEGAQPGSAGQASAGQTVWSVSEETSDGVTETVLRIRVEVPERGITANLSLKPNRDSSLPASHLLEISFDLPSGFAGRGVDEVPGLVMKTTEEARGEALIGASVKVNDGFFWVALSNVPDEQERNLSLLKDRGWIDIPMLYENGKRAILTLEKGTPGTRAVDQAVAAWTRS
uniref:hypothetical protein n=1 Tax=Stappia sp. TaxID=1870903 RepID=UPI003BAD9DF5